MTANIIGGALIVFASLVLLNVWGSTALKRRRIEQIRERLNF